jgi:hypothetical protein
MGKSFTVSVFGRRGNQMKCKTLVGIATLCAFSWHLAQAQSASEIAALKGLAPVTALENTSTGKAALKANYKVTGGIQTGEISQPTLLPFTEQQQQALQDAFSTVSNLAQLSDGLGTTLGAAYIARYHYIDEKHYTKLPQAVADLVAYATAMSGSHSNAGKYFFANETTNGKTPVSANLQAILTSIHGTQDIFGKAYNLPAGSSGANAYGDSRPFQTEPHTTKFAGKDYFNGASDNFVYNHGPAMNLTNSPSYPSGHTTYGYTGAVLLAILVPQRYAQMIARGAEYGNDRIIMGSHYAMDVMGGRTLALYDLAHLLANDPAYLGQQVRNATTVKDFQDAVKRAHHELTSALEAGCGNTIEVCAKEDTGRFNNSAANEAFYASTQTYNFPAVYTNDGNAKEDVNRLAPEAGYLLTLAFPSLTLEQADKILTETEGPGGGFLDDGSSFGIYSRLNLYAASERAAHESPTR